MKSIGRSKRRGQLEVSTGGGAVIPSVSSAVNIVENGQFTRQEDGGRRTDLQIKIAGSTGHFVVTNELRPHPDDNCVTLLTGVTPDTSLLQHSNDPLDAAAPHVTAARADLAKRQRDAASAAEQREYLDPDRDFDPDDSPLEEVAGFFRDLKLVPFALLSAAAGAIHSRFKLERDRRAAPESQEVDTDNGKSIVFTHTREAACGTAQFYLNTKVHVDRDKGRDSAQVAEGSFYRDPEAAITFLNDYQERLMIERSRNTDYDEFERWSIESLRNQSEPELTLLLAVIAALSSHSDQTKFIRPPDWMQKELGLKPYHEVPASEEGGALAVVNIALEPDSLVNPNRGKRSINTKKESAIALLLGTLAELDIEHKSIVCDPDSPGIEFVSRELEDSIPTDSGAAGLTGSQKTIVTTVRARPFLTVEVPYPGVGRQNQARSVDTVYGSTKQPVSEAGPLSISSGSDNHKLPITEPGQLTNPGDEESAVSHPAFLVIHFHSLDPTDPAIEE